MTEKFTLWANFDECVTVHDVAALAKALSDAALQAEDTGCTVALGQMDIFSIEVEVTGYPEAITTAFYIFEEFGFTTYSEEGFDD